MSSARGINQNGINGKKKTCYEHLTHPVRTADNKLG